MKDEDKALLIDEIRGYCHDKNYSQDGEIISERIFLINGIIRSFSNRKNSMKLLINNEYGLLGNLIYKYIVDPDNDIKEMIIKADSCSLIDCYRKYGKKMIDVNEISCNKFSMLILTNYDHNLNECIGDYLKNSEIFMYEAIVDNPSIIQFASVKLLKNKEFILNTIKINPLCYEFVGRTYQADKKVSYEAIKRNGLCIQWSDYTLKMDKELMMLAVKNNGKALFYGFKNTQDDYEIVFEAVKNAGQAYIYASKRLRDDYSIVTEALKNDGLVLNDVNTKYKNRKEIVLMAVRNKGSAIKFAPSKFKDDVKVAREAMKSDPFAYRYLSERLKTKKEFIDIYEKYKEE